ncbi:hypothetical protein BH11PLA2_BH11PLA2_28290 [soil metagenome]
MLNRILTVALAIVMTSSAVLAGFNVTGDPGADGYQFKGQSLAPGNYARSGGGGVFSFDMYAHEFSAGSVAALTSMTNPWNANDRVIMMGGVLTPGVTANSLGWTGAPGNTAVNPGNQRVNTKFGVNVPGAGPLGNTFTASTTAPTPGNGSVSFSGGGGGLGSVLVSIGSGNMTSANPLTPPSTSSNTHLITPNGVRGDDVAQFIGLFNAGLGIGGNGLDLENLARDFLVARYAYSVDGDGLLTSWEVFLNTTMVQNYVSPYANPSAVVYPTVPTGGQRWDQTVSNGSGGPNSDSLILTDVFSAPAPPAIALFGLGTLGLGLIRRVRR